MFCNHDDFKTMVVGQEYG